MADLNTRDYLTTLTPELQHMIFDYLLPSHEPDKALEGAESAKPERKSNDHPLDYLAATCKAMRDEVNEWALHFLAQHREVTKYRPLKTASRQEKRDFLRGRNGLLSWADKHCVFCGNKSSRSAILMNGLKCCMKCDREQWPDKITKTDARMKFDLKDEHLLPGNAVSPTAVKMLQRLGLPKVRYGTYITSNVPTTMFLRKDVEALAKLAHGDLKAHLAKRQADRDERRKKAKETKARRDEAEKARTQRIEHAELLWLYKHKHHSITTYGSEDGPTTPPQPVSTSPSPDISGGKKTRKHKKTLSIDSDAANEGRDIKPPPPKQPSPVPSPVKLGIIRVAPNYSAWDDLPSMFGMEESEWDALTQTPVKPTIEVKPKYGELEGFGAGKGKGNVDGGVGLGIEVYGNWESTAAI